MPWAPAARVGFELTQVTPAGPCHSQVGAVTPAHSLAAAIGGRFGADLTASCCSIRPDREFHDRYQKAFLTSSLLQP
jgi:hypothetical protein